MGVPYLEIIYQSRLLTLFIATVDLDQCLTEAIWTSFLEDPLIVFVTAYGRPCDLSLNGD